MVVDNKRLLEAMFCVRGRGQGRISVDGIAGRFMG